MQILIVENEIYLAQSIASKLSEIGYVCEIVTSIKDALKDNKYDAVLLSTNISGQNFYPIIKKHKSSIIILMIAYISNDTTLNPIKAGASDYIQKPFMIEELIRKLKNLQEFNELLVTNETYSTYFDYNFQKVQVDFSFSKKILSPVLLKCGAQNFADAIMFNYFKEHKEPFVFISLNDPQALEKISKNNFASLLYLVDFQNVKKNDKSKILNIIESRRVVLSSTSSNETAPFETIEIISNENIFARSDILSIEDYVKSVIVHFQDKLPDTELSKKLGISRKSLWEKRKKYDMQKRS